MFRTWAVRALAGAALLGIVASAGPPAHATLFNAAYELEGGDVVSFMLDGSIDIDGDTVVVNSLLMTPEFNGTAPSLGAISGFLSITDVLDLLAPGDPVVNPALLSFSGDGMDFAFFNDFNDDGFFLDTAGVFFGVPGFLAGVSYGDTEGELFVSARWSLVPKVPEPASILLFGLGLAALAFMRQRKRPTNQA